MTFVHSSVSLSIIHFLQRQFLLSRYSPIPQDLSHSHSQLLGLQLIPLSQAISSTKSSLHSHLHLSSLQICLLLHTISLNLQIHLQLSCHSICLVSLILEIRSNTLTLIFLITSGIKILPEGLLMLLQLPLQSFTLIL